jgi:adenosine deaminase
MPVDRIWQAVYCLNAERIGHGLTLKNNTDLEKKFRERRIGIEMCPSSNYQVIGFRDNYVDGAEARRVKGKFLQEYPLKNYLDKNLRVSINTDDPGISRTCMTNELLKAGRLTHDGLSLWNVFSLLYNGFDTAFLPFEQKNELLADMNESIRLWIENNIGNVETELKKRG